MHHKDKHDVANHEYTYIQTHSLEEMHAQPHCYCKPNLKSTPRSTGVSFPCQVKKYTATATQSRRLDWAAAQRCMRSYPGTAAQTRRVDRRAVEGSLCVKQKCFKLAYNRKRKKAAIKYAEKKRARASCTCDNQKMSLSNHHALLKR